MKGHPVIWRPGNTVIGNATSERGAISVCARHGGLLQMPKRERFTATLAETIDDYADLPDRTRAWFCGPQLIIGGKR